ncbi:MAG TPA: 50S ribosomal protein L25 [Clostridia bacterium]|nr:50S ribosomal protein L25 [Clostridia bacterium]
MDFFSVEAEKRDALGKAEIRRLKGEGMVPGILYDENENVPIALDQHDLVNLINKHGSNIVLDLNLEGKKVKTYIKEIQRAPVSQDILHIDLMPLGKGMLH